LVNYACLLLSFLSTHPSFHPLTPLLVTCEGKMERVCPSRLS
jgi:hypothetical protein